MKCQIIVFVDRNFPLAWDFDPSKSCAINKASMIRARATAEKTEKAKTESRKQFRIEEAERRRKEQEQDARNK